MSSSVNINYMQMGAIQGWQCPICKRILAPFIAECPCRGQGMETWTSTTSTADISDKCTTSTEDFARIENLTNRGKYKRNPYEDINVYFNKGDK